MGLPLKREEQRFTYRDYVRWPEGERWELIDGTPYDMSPAPSTAHQRILRELAAQFSEYLRGKTCEVFFAPFDVRLPQGDEKDEDVLTVVQPDLVVICEKSRIDEKGGRGAPDLIVEILSPATARKDMREKLSLYERVGVGEYWVVHPTDETVMIFKPSEKGLYGRPEVFAKGDEIRVGIFDDFVISLDAVFVRNEKDA